MIANFKTIMIVLLSGALLFSLSECNNEKEENASLSLENTILNSVKNTLDQTVITQKTEITHSKEALRAATDSFFNLRKKDEKKVKDVIAFYHANTSTVIKEVAIPYVDSISLKKWEDSIALLCSEVIAYYEKSTIPVPRHATQSTDEFSASLTATSTGITIDSILIPNNQSIRFITAKGGFLKKDLAGKRHLFLKKSIQVQVVNSNSLITVSGQTSAMYTPEKKFRWGEKGALILIGLLIGTQL
jgi:hypothetical protein